MPPRKRKPLPVNVMSDELTEDNLARAIAEGKAPSKLLLAGSRAMLRARRIVQSVPTAGTPMGPLYLAVDLQDEPRFTPDQWALA